MDWVLSKFDSNFDIRYYNQQTFGSILNVLCKNVWLSNILMKHEKKYQYLSTFEQSLSKYIVHQRFYFPNTD